MALALVGLGSNVGDRQRWLESAVEKLRALAGCEVRAVSSWAETAPAGGPANQSAHLNGCALLQCSLSPEPLLAALQQIENDLERTREQRWGPRTIDLDLLLYDDLLHRSPSLTIPHPRMAWRRFVVEPAAEIASNLRHAVVGWTMQQLRDHLAQTPPYLAIAGPIAAGKSTLAQVMAVRHNGALIEERFSPQQLEAFYADPAGQAWQTELEFLLQRTNDLACDRAIWSDRRRPIISDFWFDQSLAFARVWLPKGMHPAYLEQWHKARKRVVRPRLTVLIDAPTQTLVERIRARARAGEQALEAARLDALRLSLQQQAQQSDVGPVMQLSCDEQGNWENEISAAIAAMM